MDSETFNITKVKDGFFLGDEMTATNYEVLVSFKISHIINAAGPQIRNAWENLNIKYLTLNWSESPNQHLFDPKDEIANRIVSFIDDSIKTGEGFLVHSVRGQNRACLVVLIYFIRKFRWSLRKSLEFLTSKKSDIDIPIFFSNQLSNYETRLTKSGQGPKSNGWNDVGIGQLNDIDNEEVMIRNTYLNGFISNIQIRTK
jgi:protein-tyrosine phosphatase